MNTPVNNTNGHYKVSFRLFWKFVRNLKACIAMHHR